MDDGAQGFFLPLSHEKRERELSKAIHEELRASFDARRNELFERRNTMHYLHGTHWALSDVPGEDQFSQYKQMSAETTLWHNDVIDHRVNVLDEYIAKMTDEMQRSVLSNVFETVHQSTERTGNVVKGSGNIAADMMQMLEKIDFGSDRSGRPSPPELHVGPEQGKKIIKQLEAQPEEYQQQWVSLVAKKEKAATKQEADRISRFRL